MGLDKETGINFKWQKSLKPSDKSIGEALDKLNEDFYKANGYYMTEEDAVRLTDEAREEIRKERSKVEQS